MSRVSIYRNNAAFLVEQQRSGNGKVPPIMPNDLARLPAGASILIGDRSADFGGGLASIGYVMVAGKAIATIPVSPSDVYRGDLGAR